MIKKIVEISKDRYFLSVSYGQLILKDKNNPEESKSIPIEDIGVLIVDNKATSYTHSVFTELLKNNCAVILCNDTHHPIGMFLPLDTNSVQAERFRMQISVKEPLKKQLWKQIVQAKIKHQAKVVKEHKFAHKYLLHLAKSVRSGDPDNIEAKASRIFWSAFLNDKTFKRDPNGPAPNNLLNYGYMVLRAAIARALCSAGLLPTLGIHHRNRYNAYCLADDIIEPFRGFVESKVKEICSNLDNWMDLTQEIKAELLSVLYTEVKIAGFKGPLMVGLHRTAASLVRCFEGRQKRLELPEVD